MDRSAPNRRSSPCAGRPTRAARPFLIGGVVCSVLLGACGAEDEHVSSTTIDAADGTVDVASDTGVEGGHPDLGDADGSAALMTLEEAMDAVDPFIGSGGIGFGYAALTPAVQTPFGMVRLGPDTTNGGNHLGITHFSGYNHVDPDVRGFSHTHFVGTGVVDYGNLRVLPVRDLAGHQPGTHYTRMDKASEEAEPGYYSVHLPGEDALVELTSSTRAGVHRYSFGGDEEAFVLLDAAASVADEGVEATEVVASPSRVTGWVRYRGGYVGRTRPFTLYFDATVDPPAGEAYVWDDTGYLTDQTEASGVSTGVVLTFPVPDGVSVNLQVGVSMVDADQAELNREMEVAGLSFDEVRAANRALWEGKLSRIAISAETDPTVARILYTAQYNAYRMPTRLDGVDGRYRGLDGEVHKADGFAYYTDLSLWDTFRTLHPWLELTDPEAESDCLQSLMAMRSDGGFFPRWPAALSYTNGMIGSSADMLFAGGALKRVDGVDYDEAFEGLLETATTAPPAGHPSAGRDGVEDYALLGYLPSDRYGTSVSKTLEYAYADWALANLAEHLGRSEAAMLRARGANYRNVFHADSGFFRARDSAGQFDTSHRLNAVFMGSESPYTEGSAWHWRFYALQNPDDMADLLGGPDALGDELQQFFEESGLGSSAPVSTLLPDPYYWHGNEPAIHAAYLFWAAGRYDRLAYWVREIQTRLYGDGPDGLPGNDDGGTLSAWYLFSAIGLYPVSGSDLYLLGTPLVPYARVSVGAGATLTVVAPGADVENRYVRSVRLDGEPVEEGRLRHADLLDATLVFEMSDTP